MKGVPAAQARRPAPPFTEEHEELRDSIRRFVARELRPHATEWEDARWFPDEVFHKLAGAGFLGLKYPVELGGEGGDHVHDAVLAEELPGCGSGGVAAGIGAHTEIARLRGRGRVAPDSRRGRRWCPGTTSWRTTAPGRTSSPRLSRGSRR